MAVRGRVFIAGHTGLLGSACARRWSSRTDVTLLTPRRQELDLTDQAAVTRWLAMQRPDLVIMAAGRVGGINANAQYPAEFLYQNLMIEANLIHGAWQAGVARVIFFGSACMYPKRCRQPMSTDLLLTGRLEPTSEPYAIAKLAGLSLCASYNRQYGTRFVSVIPCTLYGPGDNFDPDASHVISALIGKLHDAKEHDQSEVTLWGSGQARREFLYVDDLAEACERLLDDGQERGPINIGAGESVTIHELAAMIAELVGYRGRIAWDASRPDGPSEKRLDSSAMRRLRWSPRVGLRDGLARTYQWFLDHHTRNTRATTACTSS